MLGTPRLHVVLVSRWSGPCVAGTKDCSVRRDWSVEIGKIARYAWTWEGARNLRCGFPVEIANDCQVRLDMHLRRMWPDERVPRGYRLATVRIVAPDRRGPSESERTQKRADANWDHVENDHNMLQQIITERDEARAWVDRLTSEQRVLTCAFCGEAYPPGTPESNHVALTAHVKVCAKHPMRETERVLRELMGRVFGAMGTMDSTVFACEYNALNAALTDAETLLSVKAESLVNAVDVVSDSLGDIET